MKKLREQQDVRGVEIRTRNISNTNGCKPCNYDVRWNTTRGETETVWGQATRVSEC